MIVNPRIVYLPYLAYLKDTMDYNKFKMGYFILWKADKSFFSRAIVKQQIKAGFSPENAQYCHVETSGGGNHSVDIVWPKSKLIEINKTHKGRGFKLVRYKNADYEARGRYKVAYFSASKCNLRYDWRGALRFLIKWIPNNDNTPFCSEGNLWALQMVYKGALGGLNPRECLPSHFCNKNDFEAVYEGVIE